MSYEIVHTHGTEKDNQAINEANKACSPQRYVAEVEPVLYGDTELYRVVEEPLTPGDMRHTYFLEL